MRVLYGSALDAIDEGLKAGTFFPSALDAVYFAQNNLGGHLSTYEKELRLKNYGTCWFPKTGSEKRYLHLSSSAPLIDFVQDFMQREWGLSKPSLIISITGGAADFRDSFAGDEAHKARLHKRLERFFKRGLVRSAQAKGNTWLITGGFDAGCMKYTGDAVGALSKHGARMVTTIGICTFGRVSGNKVFLDKKPFGSRVYNTPERPEPGKAFLNPDHTNYIFVGDEESNWGSEIQFRAELEDRYFSSGIPMLLVVVNGGPGTINTVHEAVKGGVPVFIVKGSGRAADLLALCADRCNDGSSIDPAEIMESWRRSGGQPLWKDTEESLYQSRLRDILHKGRLSVFDLTIGDQSMQIVEEVIFNLQRTKKRNAKASFHNILDGVMRKSPTVLSSVQLSVNYPPNVASSPSPKAGTATPTTVSAASTNTQVNIASYFRAPSGSVAEEVVSVFLAKWNLPFPKLVISVAGSLIHRGDEDNVLRWCSGMIDACGVAGGWVLSTAVEGSAASYVGRTAYGTQVKAIGFAALKGIYGRKQLATKGKHLVALNKDSEEEMQAMLLKHLDPGHNYFVLVGDVDDRRVVSFSPETRRRGLDKHSLLNSEIRSPSNSVTETPNTHLSIEFEPEESPTGSLQDASTTKSYRKNRLTTLRKSAVKGPSSGKRDMSLLLQDAEFKSDEGHMLRFEFEEYWTRHGVAVVLVVIAGGLSSLHNTLRAVRTGIPIVVCAGSGRTADLLQGMATLRENWLKGRAEMSLDLLMISNHWADDEQAIQLVRAAYGEKVDVLDVVEDLVEIIEDGMLSIIPMCADTSALDVKQSILRVVVEKGTVGVSDTKGESSLMYAARTNNISMASRMLDEGDLLTTPDKSSFLLALKYQNYDIALMICKLILDTVNLPKFPSFHDIFGECDSHGNTPVMYAAYYNYVDILQMMEDAYRKAASNESRNFRSFGASTTSAKYPTMIFDVNCRNNLGESALHFAIRGGSIKSVGWLLRRLADPLLPPDPTKTPVLHNIAPPLLKEASSAMILRSAKSLQKFYRGNGDIESPDVDEPQSPRILPQGIHPYHTPYELSLVMWQTHVEDAQQAVTKEKEMLRNKKNAMMTFIDQSNEEEERDNCSHAAQITSEIVDVFVYSDATASEGGLGLGSNIAVEAVGHAIHNHRSSFAMKQFAKKVVPYIMFLVIVTMTVSLMRNDINDRAFFLQAHIEEILTKAPLTEYCIKNFGQIENLEDFGNWIKGPFMSNFVVPFSSSEWTNNQTSSPLKPLDGVASVIGPIRIRQVRVKDHECETTLSSSWKCFPQFSASTEATDPFGSRLQYVWSSTEDLDGFDDGTTFLVSSVFPSSGYIVDLPQSNADTAIKLVEEMLSEKYFDDATRAVYFSINLFHEDMEVIAMIRIAFEFMSTGGIEPLFSVVHYSWPSSPNVVLIILQLILVAINVGMLLLWIKRCYKQYQSSVSFVEALRVHISQGFNAWDLINILFFAAVMLVHFLVLWVAYKTFGGGLKNNTFYNASDLSKFVTIERDLMAVFIFISCAKTLKYLQLIPKFGPILQAIFQTIVNRVIFAYLGFFLLFILVISLSFHFAFGMRLREFYNLEKSWFSTLRIMFGEVNSQILWETQNFYTANPGGVAGLGGFFFMFLALTGNLIIMNITIAVIAKVYEQSLKDYSQANWETMLTRMEASHLWDKLPSKHASYKLHQVLPLSADRMSKKYPNGNGFAAKRSPREHRSFVANILNRFFGSVVREVPVFPLREEVVNKYRGRKALKDAATTQTKKMQKDIAAIKDQMSSMMASLKSLQEKSIRPRGSFVGLEGISFLPRKAASMDDSDDETNSSRPISRNGRRFSTVDALASLPVFSPVTPTGSEQKSFMTVTNNTPADSGGRVSWNWSDDAINAMPEPFLLPESTNDENNNKK